MLRDALGEIIGQLTPEISRWPRREPGQIIVDGKLMKYADMHSFFYQAKQIFGDGLYHFSCDTDSPSIIDCGAHIGLASLFFAEQYPKARLQVFEADPEIAVMCDANLKAFGCQDFTVEAKAAWISNDGVSFSNSRDDSGHVGDDGADTITVPSVRLKTLIESGPVDLLKLDIEGAEYTVLEDCGDSLKSVGRMVIEAHIMRPEEGRLGALLAQLETLDFQYVLHDLHHATWLDVGTKPPFAACPTDKYVITIFAWKN